MKVEVRYRGVKCQVWGVVFSGGFIFVLLSFAGVEKVACGVVCLKLAPGHAPQSKPPHPSQGSTQFGETTLNHARSIHDLTTSNHAPPSQHGIDNEDVVSEDTRYFWVGGLGCALHKK